MTMARKQQSFMQHNSHKLLAYDIILFCSWGRIRSQSPACIYTYIWGGICHEDLEDYLTYCCKRAPVLSLEL